MSDLHQTAREWAANGVPCFPCWPGTKIPATDDGFKSGTTDLAQIDRWWTDNPNYNIAFEPGAVGWTVVDPEFEADPDWNDGRELPETYTVRTPRGGKHLYYVGECRSSVKKLARDVDTRGKGGYVLIPPSIVEGRRYGLIDSRDMAPLPSWIPPLIGKQRAKREAAADVVLDTKDNIFRAVHYLTQLPATSEGDGSDAKAYVACCWLRELGLSEHKAAELMLEHFKCDPLDQDWVEKKVASAFQYAQNDAGASGLSRPSEEVFAKSPALIRSKTERAKLQSKFHFRDDAEMDKSPKPTWILPGIIPEGQICLLAAKKGSFKTFLSMDMCLGVATNTIALGLKPDKTGPTFFGAHEGRYAIESMHRAAWRLAHEIEGATQFYVSNGPRIIMEDERTEFIEQIKKRTGNRMPRLIVLDTYSACMLGHDENSPLAANSFVAFCRDMIDLWPQCSVIVPAHFGKNEDLGVRGSNALEAGVDTVIDLKREDTEARIVKLRVRHHRSAPEPTEALFFEGKVLADSLVFQPISKSQHAQAMATERPFTKAKIGAALKLLGAYEPKAVTTSVLIGEMFRIAPDEAVEGHIKRMQSMKSELLRLARTTYGEYKTGEGRDIKWSLPAKDDPYAGMTKRQRKALDEAW